jgi:hypothetical protein
MLRAVSIFVALTLVISCTPPPPIDKDTLDSYRLIYQMRDEQFRSAAYLIDLRVNDDGNSYSVNTELYFSGDSVGFYGRGYLGKGAFRGNIVNDIVTLYFNSQREYYTGPLADIGSDAECASPGEVLLVVLSLLTGRDIPKSQVDVLYPSRKEIRFRQGRFERTVELDHRGYPQSEKLIDSLCKDSIVIQYLSSSREFPFYKVRDALFYNELFNFRARGFIREQKYNIDIKPRKFMVEIPPDAVRLESI